MLYLEIQDKQVVAFILGKLSPKKKKKKFNKCVPINSIGYLFIYLFLLIRDLRFEYCLHKKLISVLG